MSHAKPFAVGLNCALGASDMQKYVANLSKCADCYVFCYPNAGLPNAMGGYDQKGPAMAEEIRPFCEDKLVNALGGCCGSGPEHIAAIRFVNTTLVSYSNTLKCWLRPALISCCSCHADGHPSPNVILAAFCIAWHRYGVFDHHISLLYLV